jgi:hypothetical protein
MELDQDLDWLGNLLLLRRMRVSRIVTIILQIFSDAGVDLVEEAHWGGSVLDWLERDHSKNPT